MRTSDSTTVDEVIDSPHFDSRVDMVVLHSIATATTEAALTTLTSPGLPGVSAHYLVTEDGRIIQLVAESDRAWHAGASSWAGSIDVNFRSIGIEVSVLNKIAADADFPAAQIDALIRLCRDVIVRHRIRSDRIVGHSDVAPTRKSDPGEKFPWPALHAADVGHWVEPAPLTQERGLALGDNGSAVVFLQNDLRQYGYGIAVTGQYDDASRQVVQAFQRHFRPARVDGIADPSTVTTLRNLLAARLNRPDK